MTPAPTVRIRCFWIRILMMIWTMKKFLRLKRRCLMMKIAAWTLLTKISMKFPKNTCKVIITNKTKTKGLCWNEIRQKPS